MRNISKSAYTQFLKCPKMLWYNTHGYEKALSENTRRTLDNGTEFGIMAQTYFGDCVLVEKESNISMIEQTNRCLEAGAENIAEATFVSKGGYCQADILHRNENGRFDIVEVKSSTQIQSYYLDDVAFQYYVIRDCVPIDRCFILHMNNLYRRQGALSKELFVLEDVTEKVKAKLKPKAKKPKKGEAPADTDKDLIGEAISKINQLLDGDLPDMRVHAGCDDQWECPFMEACVGSLDASSRKLMSCTDLTWKQRIKCLEKGEMVYPRGKEVLKLPDDETIIDRDGIKSYLAGLTYPLYLLDFESIQNIVPQYENQRPWQQTPFQYSLHIMQKPDDTPQELIHREFLWDENSDPREALVKQLVRDIPADGCAMAYNMMFEKMIIEDLAEVYPEYAEQLMSIHANFTDLMVPFRQQLYYKGSMRGSYSIKKVLPACYPNDPELDYHNLEEVQNGTMAQEKYLALIDMKPSAEKERLRKNMLKYCELDTFAMYKLLRFLYGVSEAEVPAKTGNTD